MAKLPRRLLFLISVMGVLFISPIRSIEFIFNGFNESTISLFGSAAVESELLRLTNDTKFTIGRALYPSKIPTRSPNSSVPLPFYTSFVFSMAPYRKILPGHGIVFLFVPFAGVHSASSAQHLGFLNLTTNGDGSNHIMGVEFDVFQNEEFHDIDDNHVGIDVNSLKSSAAQSAGFFPADGSAFKKLKLNDGRNYQVWIDYADLVLNVTMAPAGDVRPRRPLLSFPIDLSTVLLEETYVGFTGSTGKLVEAQRILRWSFSNSNPEIGNALIAGRLPSFVLPKLSISKSKGFKAGVTMGVLVVLVLACSIVFFIVKDKRRRTRQQAEVDEWELEFWPHRINYQELETATKSFSESNVIGVGGNGKVYKGVLAGGGEVALKRISHETDEGIREFVAEVSSLGRLKHRNLVGLKGWCKKEKGSLILVYEYMENGSLDKWLFDCDESKALNWETRLRILKDVASGIFYLHEGWESKVLHRDIKSSNVLLDRLMVGKLGDFGLARLHDHGQQASTTRVVGTVGYLAPELIRTGRVSTQTDVYGFGVLVLEAVCGRRPLEVGMPPLLEWAWGLLEKGDLSQAVDLKMRDKGGLDEEEVEKVLQMGLLCTQPDPAGRPTMRQVMKFFERKNEMPEPEMEGMEMHLLHKAKSRGFGVNMGVWVVGGMMDSSTQSSNPTMEEIERGIFTSSSWSDTTLVPR